MDPLKQKFQEKAAALKTEIKAVLKEKGNTKVDEVTLNQIFGGARGIKTMVWETSHLDPVKGIHFRGYTIPELRKLLPKGANGKEPLPEGLFWLMLVGEIPTEDEVRWLADRWIQRSNVPYETYKVIEALPKETHPMTQFIIGINSMDKCSMFTKWYSDGISKSEYWNPMYEDAMNLIARLPRLAAFIYRRSFHNDKHITPDISLDWAANFARMLGNESDDFKNLMRLYLTIHADHEGGNASAHTSHLINSTLSNPYLAFAGGMASLAGPLHGLANQEVIKWVFKMNDALGTTNPTKAQIADYVKGTLASGQVIPGYGHAVLRRTDPRYSAQMDFSKKYIKDSDINKTVWKIYEVVPPILKSLGKVKNPWPNVDAHSGALLVHYGIKEYSFYTVLFGVSRALGILSSLVWSRALGFPLERPKSVTYNWVKNFITENEKKKK